MEVKVFLGFQVLPMCFGSQDLGHLPTYGAELRLEIKCLGLEPFFLAPPQPTNNFSLVLFASHKDLRCGDLFQPEFALFNFSLDKKIYKSLV